MAEKGAVVDALASEAGSELSSKGPETPQNSLSPSAAELPADVRSKLRKLEKLESRYQGNIGRCMFVFRG